MMLLVGLLAVGLACNSLIRPIVTKESPAADMATADMADAGFQAVVVGGQVIRAMSAERVPHHTDVRRVDLITRQQDIHRNAVLKIKLADGGPLRMLLVKRNGIVCTLSGLPSIPAVCRVPSAVVPCSATTAGTWLFKPRLFKPSGMPR